MGVPPPGLHFLPHRLVSWDRWIQETKNPPPLPRRGFLVMLCAYLDDIRKSSPALKSLISRASSGIGVDRQAGSGSSITDERGPVVQSIEKLRNTGTPEMVNQMRELYASGLSLKNVPKRIGVARETVTHNLRKSGVQLRNQGLDEVGVGIAKKRYLAGETLSQIGGELGVSATTVGSYLRAAGVELRPSRAVAGAPRFPSV